MITFPSLLSLIGLLLSFTLIIILIRFKFNFGISLIIGSIILGVFSLQVINIFDLIDTYTYALLYSFKTNAYQTRTLELAILMSLIYILASLMQKTGAVSKLINSLRIIFTKGETIALIPAFYGLMPVPGGALFSAPTINEEGDNFKINVNLRNFFNIWFRHIWFPVYPISLSIIIMVELAQINTYDLIIANFSAFLIMIILGFIILSVNIRRNNPELKNIDKKKALKNESNGFLFLIPPFIPLFFYFITFSFLPMLIAFIIGVIISIIILFYLIKIDLSKYIALIKESFTIKFALMISGIIIFRDIFEVTGINANIFSLLEQLPFPHIILIVLFPFFLGFITGYIMSGITLSYLLLEPFFAFTDVSKVGLVSILFMSAFLGYLISPIHPCNVVSSEYLKTDTTRMYKIFIPATLTILLLHVIIIILIY
jgi:integral membrane protein (TIGR00529 family)